MARFQPRQRPRALPVAPAADQAPAVCRAGVFQFAARQIFTNPCVQSRALFWCKSGRGEFMIDGVTYPLEPHDLYVLPWSRRITYLPSARDPMYTGHVHLIPWYRPGAPWHANVPHEPGELYFDSPDRRDCDWPTLRGAVRLRVLAEERLGRLMDYTIRWYLESERVETEARALGVLLIREVLRTAAERTESVAGRPEELRRILVHIERGFHLGPNVKELAGMIRRSRSHVLKLFRRHLGISAKEYVIGRQLREARELLLNSTLPIAEVGRSVGQPDPYHFSKLFRRHVGLSPREFREKHGPFAAPPQPSHHVAVPPLHRPHPGTTDAAIDTAPARHA